LFNRRQVELEVLDCGVRVSDFFRISEVEFRISRPLHHFSLADCYRNALRLADANGLESIALPAISIGASGHPFIEGTETACRTILQTAPSLSQLKHIRLVFLSAKSANIACTLFSQEMRLRV
jgi:O-acetyl-ADP-ribose deacetylase (regulator of RNase III)